jgi:hypothetical protein
MRISAKESRSEDLLYDRPSAKEVGGGGLADKQLLHLTGRRPFT